MLKKIVLIFLKTIPFILASILLSKTLLQYIFTNNAIIELLDSTGMLIIISWIILLSFIFKYCIYYRLLLYLLIGYYIVNILYLFKCLSMTLSVIIYFLIPITILFVFIIVYLYLNNKKNEQVKTSN